MCEDYRPHQHAYRAYFFLSRSHIAYIFPHTHAKVKFGLSEKQTKFEKILPHGFDKSADLLSKCQNHGEDFFKLCALLKKSELYANNFVHLHSDFCTRSHIQFRTFTVLDKTENSQTQGHFS